MLKRKRDVDYWKYIRSPEWRSKHPKWLKQCNHRCSMFPWVIIGKRHRRRYRRYEMHHTNYQCLRREKFWWDVLPLCPFAHDWIIHGILAGFKSAGKQESKYPNAAQRLAHSWCRLPAFLKQFLFLVLLAGILSGVGVIAFLSLRR